MYGATLTGLDAGDDDAPAETTAAAGDDGGTDMPLYDDNMCQQCFYDKKSFFFCCETGKPHGPRLCETCGIDLAGAKRVPKFCPKTGKAHEDARQKQVESIETGGTCSFCAYPLDSHQYCTATGWKHDVAEMTKRRAAYLGGTAGAKAMAAAPKPVPAKLPNKAPAAAAAAAPAAAAAAPSAVSLPGVGAVVETHGLSKDELNGLQGSVIRHQGDRVVVELPQPHGEKALRPCNLQVIAAAPEAAAEEPAAKRARTDEPVPEWAGVNGAGPELDYWNGVQAASKVLVVGDGNFSFSYCLARRLGNAEQMVCTDAVMNTSVRETAQHYLVPLLDLGATVCARLDATRLGKHCLVRRCGQYFDYIAWNFPHSSTPNKADHSQEEHRQLLKRFLQQAELVLAKGGRCSITVKDGYPYSEWQVHTLATGRMHFIGWESFTAKKFPIYAHVTTRSGAGINRVFPAHTYVFGMTDK